jgi:hypothetical protein
MAGFDLACLASGLLLGWAAWKMQRAGRAQVSGQQRTRSTHLEQEAN